MAVKGGVMVQVARMSSFPSLDSSTHGKLATLDLFVICCR